MKNIFPNTHAAKKETVQDTTAMLVSKLLADSTGDMQPTIDTMNALFNDPERMGGVVMTMTSLIAQLTKIVRPPKNAQDDFGNPGLIEIIENNFRILERDS